jgi:hypothetical protein
MKMIYQIKVDIMIYTGKSYFLKYRMKGFYMKKILSICSILVVFFLLIIAGINSYGKDNNGTQEDDWKGIQYKIEHEHQCGPTRWEIIERSVFDTGTLFESATDERKYYGPNTLDENENTAWCVGGEEVIGKNISYKLGNLEISDDTYGIEILPGFAMNEKLFRMNNRPKKLLLEFIEWGDDIKIGRGDKAYMSSEERIAYKKELNFKDEKKYQKFFFDGKSIGKIQKEFNKNNNFNNEKYGVGMIRLTILEIYKGTTYDDTCISEVRFLDKKGKPMKILQKMYLDEAKHTAWCESGEVIGKKIEYIREQLNIPYDSYGIDMLPGLTKNEKLFRMNNRPKKLLLEFIGYGKLFKNNEGIVSHEEQIVYKKELNFKDEISYQKFFFDGKSIGDIKEEFNKKNNIREDKFGLVMIRLTIFEIYKGTISGDTCISEVRLLNKKGKPMKILPNMK